MIGPEKTFDNRPEVNNFAAVSIPKTVKQTKTDNNV